MIRPVEKDGSAALVMQQLLYAADVRSIQEIAEKSHTLVIAEGIEKSAELMVLRDLGHPFAQGYHLGRPQAMPQQESQPVPEPEPPAEESTTDKATNFMKGLFGR